MESSDKKDSPDSDGPLLLLKEAVSSGSQILVYCRNNRKIFGRIRAFDRHFNMLLEAVREVWSEKRKGKGKNSLKMKERFIGKMLLRGDSVIVVVRNPKEKNEGTEKVEEDKGKHTKENIEEYHYYL